MLFDYFCKEKQSDAATCNIPRNSTAMSSNTHHETTVQVKARSVLRKNHKEGQYGASNYNIHPSQWRHVAKI